MADKNINLDHLNMPEEALFSRIRNDELSSEKITAPRYSYWQSVFRVFFRKKINIVMLSILAIVIIFAYIYPAIIGYDATVNPFIHVMDSTAKTCLPPLPWKSSAPTSIGSWVPVPPVSLLLTQSGTAPPSLSPWQ